MPAVTVDSILTLPRVEPAAQPVPAVELDDSEEDEEMFDEDEDNLEEEDEDES